MDTLPLSLRSCVLEDVFPVEEIGRGSHGRVLAATWKGTPVAVKYIHSVFNDVASNFEYEKLRENFMKGCERSSQIRHPNIVRFLGIFLNEGAPIPRLVMERLSSNLDHLLMKHPVIPEGIKYNIVHGVSLGIRFLHTRRPSPIIHRDLSSKNVLVSSAMEGKIGDLGTAQFVDEHRQSQMTRAPGTVDFMPPEVLTDYPSYSISVDLFSFGCVMLHTLSHEWPTPKGPVVGDQKTRVLIALSELQRRETYMQRLINRPGSIPDKVKDLITQCLSNYAEERPKIQAVTDRLADIKSQYSVSLSQTVLDAQEQLQKTEEILRNAYNNIEEVLFPSHKPTQSSFSQVHSKLPSIRVSEEAHSSVMLTGQPHSHLLVTAGRTKSLPDLTDGSFVKRKPIPTASSPSTFVNQDQLFGINKESIEVKEKDEMVTASSHEVKLSGQGNETMLSHVVAAAPPVGPAVMKATPKTEPHPPVAKPSAMSGAPTESSQQVLTMKRTKRIIPQLESKYVALLDNLPEKYESSLVCLQQTLTDDQICDILSLPEARACNQKILNCLIEQVHCEEDVLDLCSHLEKIMGSQALVGIVEELRKDTVEAMFSTEKQRLVSGTDTLQQKLRGQFKDYKMKWDQVDDLKDKCMSTSVVELDGKVYAVLENTSARFLNIHVYDSKTNTWASMPPLQYGATSLATIPNKGQLLAIGGIYHPDSNCSNISKKVYLWDKKYETWLTIYPDMLTPRCYCCSVGYKSMVIVAGGTLQYKEHRNTGAVEILMAHDTNPCESQWCVVRSMPTLMYRYMVPVLIDETLYIACGFRKGLPFSGYNILSAYIPALLKSTNHDIHPAWNHLPELPYSSFSISHINGHLVAFGGEQLDMTATRRSDGGHRLRSISAIHVYKSVTHEWEQVGEIPHVYSLGCPVHLKENKIMFVGSFIDPSCVTDNDLMTTCSVVTITK